MHSSSSRLVESGLAVKVKLQPRRRQLALGGIVAPGSSESESGRITTAVAGSCAACGAIDAEESGASLGDVIGLLVGTTAAGTAVGSSFGVGFSGGLGVSSTVECLPVVHGGIERNSSKVKTRGLQQFQPVDRSVSQDLCQSGLKAPIVWIPSV